MNKRKRCSVILELVLLLSIIPVFMSSCDDNEIENTVNLPDKEVDSDAGKNTYEIILNRIRKANMPNSYSEIDENVDEALTLLQDNGSFSDIDYSDDSRAHWTPINHLTRLTWMAQAYTMEDSSYFKEEVLYDKILKALNFWNTARPVCTNWWYNQIGAPKAMCVILIILRDGAKTIPKDLEDSILGYLAETGGNPAKWTGANKTDIAMHWLYRGCLQTDSTLTATAVWHAYYPLQYVKARYEGFQHDYSYFQHGPQLYIGGYGLSIVDGVATVATSTVDTDFKLSDEQLDVLRKFVQASLMKSVRGKMQAYNVVGRSVSRDNQLDISGYIPVFERMKSIDVDNISLYQHFINNLKGEGDFLWINDSFRHFYIGDRSLYQGKGYTVSLRMSSTRTRKCENGNGENLKGYFLSDGSMSVAVDGDEYSNIFPVWDWTHIPGVTSPQVENIPLVPANDFGESLFCGGATAGKYGVSVMSQINRKDGMGMKACKAWFFLNNKIVCLGTGIDSDMNEEIHTSVNQSLLKGDIVCSQNNVVSNGVHVDNKALDWVWHRNIGYFFPTQQQISVHADTRKGSWADISTEADATPIEKDICSIWLNHGRSPQGASYSYVIVPNISSTEMANYKINNAQIIANTINVQAVRDSEINMTQAVFYNGGSITSDDLRISVNNPCALVIQEQTNNMFDIYFADTSHGLLDLTITIERSGRKQVYNFDYFSGDGVHVGKTHFAQVEL